MGFRDLRGRFMMALEKEEQIRRFASWRGQRLRSVVAISMQAKEQAFGVVLLGSPMTGDVRRQNLRLLLALGHRSAWPVDNSLLIQQDLAAF